jgi:hypothetical protein
MVKMRVVVNAICNVFVAFCFRVLVQFVHDFQCFFEAFLEGVGALGLGQVYGFGSCKETHHTAGTVFVYVLDPSSVAVIQSLCKLLLCGFNLLICNAAARAGVAAAAAAAAAAVA